MDKYTLPLFPVSQDEIDNILWRACDTFRGTIDASEYKNYLLVMLFVKYVSDVWAEHYEQLQKEYGDDKERILRRLARERFVLPPGCSFDDLYRQRNETNLGEIINKALEQVAPQPGERICDPTCGSGSLLIKCANFVRRQGSNDYSLYGQENTGGTWALAKMNMFLHGVDGARIEWGDTIRNPKLLENDKLMRFEVVVANPPFSLDKWGADDVVSDRFKRFGRGIPPKGKGDFAFISHTIETMSLTGGRVAVVVPHGVLFRGSSEGKIRQQLIEENLLDAVVGLPSNLFFGTGIPAAILVFKRNKPDNSVLFIDGSRDYADVKTQNNLREQDIAKIVGAYQRRETVEKYAYLASFEEIKENDFNLNIPRYVDTFEEEEEIDIGAVQAEIDGLEEELSKVRFKMAGYLEELGFVGE